MCSTVLLGVILHATHIQLERMDNRQLEGAETLNPLISPTTCSCPIHKLPVETLSHIFEYAADSFRRNPTADLEVITGEIYTELRRLGEPPCDVDDLDVRPWLPVSLVCRHWYNVALSTPSLWAFIMVPSWWFPSFGRVENQLNRSKDLPIDFLVHLIDESADHTTFRIPRVCRLLLAHAYRWRSLDVRVDVEGDMHQFLDIFFRTHTQIASQLTSVVLVCRDSTSYLPGGTFGLSAPHLNTIRLIGVAVDWNQPWISSAPNLTTLDIRDYHDGMQGDFPSWSQFTTILCGAPRLKVLILENRHFSGISDWDDSNESMSGDHDQNPIKLLELRQLVINLPPTMTTHFLRRCYIPDLCKLSLCSLPKDLDALVTQLVAPLAAIDTCSGLDLIPGTQAQPGNMFAGLDYLFLDKLYFRSGSLWSLYSSLNNLTSLVLYVFYPAGTGDPTLDLLLPSATSCIMLPRLKTLSVYPYKFPLDKAAAMSCALARERHDMGVPLSTLILRSVSRWSEVRQDPNWVWCLEPKNLETFYFD